MRHRNASAKVLLAVFMPGVSNADWAPAGMCKTGRGFHNCVLFSAALQQLCTGDSFLCFMKRCYDEMSSSIRAPC